MKRMEAKTKEKLVSLKVNADFWKKFNEFVKIQKSAGVVPSGYTAGDVIVFLLNEKMETEYGLEDYITNKKIYEEKKSLKEKYEGDISKLSSKVMKCYD